jgi:uncharacterized integral membrane protein (TIGR00698 family)
VVSASSSAASPSSASPSLFARTLAIVPGLALLFVVGYAGKWIEGAIKAWGKAHHKTLPNIEYVLWAILIGLVLGNLFSQRRWFKIFEPGIGTYELWLKLGIVLLGVRFLLADVAKLGGVSLVLVVLEIALAITVMTWLGRRFRLGPKLSALLAIGSSVCGVSAIIATQGAIDADERDTTFAIAAILALGAVALVLFPLIGHALHMSDHAYGLWVGLAIDNTAEVTAAGALYSDEAARIAVLAKTARNATIGFVVLFAALYFASRGGRAVTGSKAAFVWQKFPKFVLGFLLFSTLASFHAFKKPQLDSLANLSRWAFLLTFAGVGLRTNIAALRKQGFGPFVVGALGEVAIAVATLGMVIGADRLFHLG